MTTTSRAITDHHGRIIFRCPACGRVNADGEALPEGATDVARFTTQAGESSFAAPPPVSAPARGTGGVMPRAVLALIVVQALLTVATVATWGIEGFTSILFRVGVLGGLLVRDRAAYRAACFASLLVVVVDLHRLSGWSALPLAGHAVVVGGLALDIASLAAVFSSETRRYYERALTL